MLERTVRQIDRVSVMDQRCVREIGGQDLLIGMSRLRSCLHAPEADTGAGRGRGDAPGIRSVEPVGCFNSFCFRGGRYDPVYSSVGAAQLGAEERAVRNQAVIQNLPHDRKIGFGTGERPCIRIGFVGGIKGRASANACRRVVMNDDRQRFNCLFGQGIAATGDNALNIRIDRNRFDDAEVSVPVRRNGDAPRITGIAVKTVVDFNKAF